MTKKKSQVLEVIQLDHFQKSHKPNLLQASEKVIAHMPANLIIKCAITFCAIL